MNSHRLPGLYVHIPFCRGKCPYCGFFSIGSTSLVPRWIECVKKEMDSREGLFPCFDTLYLGGGSPTCLDAETLEELLGHIFKRFRFAPGAEITIEANPGDMTAEKCGRLKGLGFNRISLGGQSFDDEALALLGRRHSAADIRESWARLRSAGFHNMGLDLIYGFHGWSPEQWTADLEAALDLRPEHLSCYQLTYEKGTPFHRMKDRGHFKPLEETEERALFLAASGFLKQNGYIHYEVANFAREERGVSRHNSKYWQGIPYLGLGPSAHSFDGLSRWWNISSVRRYCEEIGRGRRPVAGHERLTAEQRTLEKISLGLRTRRGVDIKDLARYPGSAATLSQLESLGLLEMRGERVAPTREGFLVSDRLPLAFM